MRLAGLTTLVSNIVVALSLCHVAALNSEALEAVIESIQLFGYATVE